MPNSMNKSCLARLTIKNIGNLKHADIIIDDNCVITGHNNIGKSTITKIIFSIIKAVNLGDKIYDEDKISEYNDEEKKVQIVKFTKKYNIHFGKDNSIEDLKHHLIFRYIHRYLNSTLGENILRFGESLGEFTFIYKEFELNVQFNEENKMRVRYKGNYEWFKDATLISSTEVLNYSNLISLADTSISDSFNKSRLVSIQDKDLIDKLNTESIDMLDEDFNVKDGLGFDESGYAFYKEKGNEVQMKMLGTGKKLFIMLDKLVRNKSVDNNTLLMFDEPEEGMHPEWQLDFIEKLFDIDVHFALTTHSPYIIQSLIYNAKQKHEKVNYYVVEQDKELGYAISKQENKPLNIVKDLTNPILKVRGF